MPPDQASDKADRKSLTLEERLAEVIKVQESFSGKVSQIFIEYVAAPEKNSERVDRIQKYLESVRQLSAALLTKHAAFCPLTTDETQGAMQHVQTLSAQFESAVGHTPDATELSDIVEPVSEYLWELQKYHDRLAGIIEKRDEIELEFTLADGIELRSPTES